jgi:ferredoxin
LNQYDADTWSRAVDALAPAIHDVDRDATRIWFAFYPLALTEVLARADDPEALAKKLLIQGSHGLVTRIDTSHRFLYGHRYWPRVKEAVGVRATARTAPSSLDLVEVIRGLARTIAAAAAVDESLLLGITAVGVMTLQQVGLDAFNASSGDVKPAGRLAKLSPGALVKARAKNDSQGLFGFLRGVRTEYSVTFDETRNDATFPIINGQHLTTAAACDTRDYSADPRCFAGGPIPVECRTASCGTCWVGILGGREKLSAVEALESRRMKEFGYIETAEPRPTVRLACMAQASGNATIVIPTWNGLYGRYLKTHARSGDATAAKNR